MHKLVRKLVAVKRTAGSVDPGAGVTVMPPGSANIACAVVYLDVESKIVAQVVQGI